MYLERVTYPEEVQTSSSGRVKWMWVLTTSTGVPTDNPWGQAPILTPFPPHVGCVLSRQHFLWFLFVLDAQNEGGEKVQPLNQTRLVDYRILIIITSVTLMAGPALLQQRAVQNWSSLMKNRESQIHNSSSTLTTVGQGETLIWLLSQIIHFSHSAPYQQWKKGRRKGVSYSLDLGRQHQETPSAWEGRRGISKDR